MRDTAFLNSQRWQEQQWRAHRDGAHPDILEFERLFLKRLIKLGVPVFAHEVWRLNSRQDELYAAGMSKAKGGESPHNFGCAVDLVHSVHGWNLNAKQWALIGHVGKELATQRGFKVTWGGDWKFYDPAHWELTEWRVVRGLFRSFPHVKTVPELLACRADELAQC